LDFGLQGNLVYETFSARYNNGYRQRNLDYGAGSFLRLYPLNFIFLQVQPEHNWTTIKIKDVYNTGSSETFYQESSSVLAGVGYANRVVGQNNFYILVMMDLMHDINSPYRNLQNQASPIIRTGFDFYLKKSRKKLLT